MHASTSSRLLDGDVNRRSFIRALGLAGAAGGAVAVFGKPSTAAAATPGVVDFAGIKDDVQFWTQVRSLFTLNPRYKFMNIGTAGSMPSESLATLDSMTRKVALESESGYSTFPEFRAAIAASFGCDPDELAMSGNTSDGMCQILLGLPWEKGDEIVTTNHEHGGGNTPMALVRDRFGVILKRVKLPVGSKQKADEIVELFAKAIGPRTKAIVFSAPTYKTGTLLPIKRLAKLAQEKGIISICDGAHLPGMMKVNFHELGVDFLSGAGHKWQCGPLGTGILYVRNKVIAQFNPRPLPAYYPLVTSNYPQEGGLPARATGPKETDDIAARIQSCGSRNTPIYTTLAKSCEIWDRIGRAKIQAYTLGLSAYLKQKISDKWGEKSLYTAKDDPELVCALTSFNPFRKPEDIYSKEKSTAFVNRMKAEYGFIIRNTDFELPDSDKKPWGVRVSTHLWSTMNDVDQLVDAMWDLSGKMNA